MTFCNNNERGHMLDVDGLIRAVKSEDKIGCVLRCHLIAESIMEKAIESKTPLEASSIFDFKRNRISYFTKLQLCTALGMPIGLMHYANRLNKIRNKFGHDIDYELERALVDDLADICDRNSWSKYSKSVKKQKLELSFDEVRTIPYGQDIRLDLIITFIIFIPILVGWASTNIERRPAHKVLEQTSSLD